MVMKPVSWRRSKPHQGRPRAWHCEHIHRIVEGLVSEVPRWRDDRVLTVDVGSSVATLSDTLEQLLFGDSTA
jgi:hypothetical protein